MRIAIATREVGRNGALLRELSAAGFSALELPLTTTAPPADPAAFDRAVRSAPAGWIAFQSPRGVAAFAAALARAGLPFPAARIAAVGEGTAEALRAGSWRVDLVPVAGTGGAALAEAFSSAAGALRPGTRVLVVGAAGGRTELADTLRGAGFEVDVAIAYRTVGVDVAAFALRPITESPPPVVVLQAPSAVRSLAAAAEKAGLALAGVLVAVVPGGTTAAAVRELAPRRVVVASAPSPPALAAAAGEAARLSE